MCGVGGKKKKKGSTHYSLTLREESTGKKKANANARTMCKISHLKDLALWAVAELSSVPSIGAFFGERLAATYEVLDLRSDPSFIVCGRCESVLQLGNNCTVRTEKSKSKGRQSRKRSICTLQNNVVYRCHICSHRNVMRGTPKGYVKEISLKNPKPALGSKNTQVNHPSSKNAPATTEILFPLDGKNLDASSLLPTATTSLSLLDSKRRKRNRCGDKKIVEPVVSCVQISSKRRKKTWTSLEEIAESSSQDVGKKLKDLTIPLCHCVEL